MFCGIIDESKKFILLDSDRERLRLTALMTNEEIEVIVPEYDYDGEQTGEHTEKRYVPMFDEDTVDEAIKEYEESDIETAFNGEKYLKGFAPKKPEAEIKAERIAELEALLASKDYIGTKIATGCATIEDYAEEIAQCEEWRKEIRELKK